MTALCERVVIIANGCIRYDGSLHGIVDRFSGHKVVTLQFAEDQEMGDLQRFGAVLDIEPPKARLRIPRPQVATVLAAILNTYALEDIIVEDPPSQPELDACPVHAVCDGSQPLGLPMGFPASPSQLPER